MKIVKCIVSNFQFEMKLLFSLICAALLMQLPLYAQTNVIKEYVDENLYLTSQEEAKFYRIASINRDNLFNGIVEYYYIGTGAYAPNLYARGEYEKNSKIGK